MPSTYSSNLRIELINPGEQGNTWGNTANTNFGTILDSAIAGNATLTSWVTNVCTLSALYGANDQSRRISLIVPTGSLTAAGTISVPATALPTGSGGYGCGKVYVVINQDSFAVTIKTGSSTGVTIAAGTSRAVIFNGTDFVEATNSADKFYLNTAVTSASADNQAATKAYVDSTAGNYLPRAGGSGNNMTGNLYLFGSTYVADAVAASQGFVNGKTLALATSTGSTSAASGLIATGTFAANNLTLALAPATATNLGGVKIGSGFTLSADGTISVTGGGSSGVTSIAASSPLSASSSTGAVTLSISSSAFYPASGNPSQFAEQYQNAYFGNPTTVFVGSYNSGPGYYPTIASVSSTSSTYLPLVIGQANTSGARYGINITTAGDVNVQGNFNVSGGTKSFRIPHPTLPEKDLYHSAVEAPRNDLIYRGRVKLVGGQATINIDAESRMTTGTFVALTQLAEVVGLHNKDGFTRVRATEVLVGEFTIIAEDPTCEDEIAWIVMAERNDAAMHGNSLTDSNGQLVPEQPKGE